MENQQFLQSDTINSVLAIAGQKQNNLFSSDLLQIYTSNLNQSGSFSNPIKTEISEIEIKPVEYAQFFSENVLGKFQSEFVASINHSKSPTNLDNSDPLIGNVILVNGEAILDLAVATAKEQLEAFVSDEEFLDKLNLIFGNNWQPQEANALIQDVATGEALPKIEILPTANLNGNGAFGEGTIYLSKDFLSENIANPEAVAGVLLEEIGHYIDQELNNVDSPGDEGDIFARLVQGKTIAEAELITLKAEDDSAILLLDGKELAAELASKTLGKLASEAPPYPGYNLAYNPSAPEYNEDPAVVRLWQQRMKDLGYSIDVDGYYGSKSTQVAYQFQKDNGLKVDGYVGPQTWAASFSGATQGKTSPGKLASEAPPYPGYNLAYNPSAPEYNEDPAVVRLWQQRMKDLGYSIDVDGYYGSKSTQVAYQFQKDNGLKVDGYVGPQTWAASFSGATQGKTSPGKLTGTAPLYLAAIAEKEWEFFNRGKLKEYQEGAWQRVGEYWKSVNSNLDGKDTDVPWSAAFISWLMKQGGAGDRFEYSASHSTYITDAIEDRKNNDSDAAFFGYKLDEYSPKVGDLIGYARQNGVNFDTPAPYKSHTDLVVAVRDGEIDVIGGNVSNSVTKKTLAIDSKGRLIDNSQDWFVVLSNQLGSQPTQGKTSPGKLASEAPPYPGYNLIYNPSAPEYNEDPAVVRLWQQRMKDLGYSIDVDGYYGSKSAQVARQFQKDNDLKVDGYVGPQTWAASFSLGTSTDRSQTSSSPSITADAAERQAQAEREATYRSLYNRELFKESSLLEINPLHAETTWNMTAQEMLKENKDFLKKAAQRYGIDGRAIAGAIRWEYEESYKQFLGIKVYSREFDEFVYNQVQKTGSLDVDVSDTVADIPFGIGIYQLDGNGWGKMHFDTAIKVLKASGEKVSDSSDFYRSLSRMLALSTSSIDLIARSMRQAVDAYWEFANVDISNKPEILATLYNNAGYFENYKTRAEKLQGDPTYKGNPMGEWVSNNLDSLEDYKTQGRLYA